MFIGEGEADKMSEISESVTEEKGQKPVHSVSDASSSGMIRNGIDPDTDNLLKRMVERNNMMEAYRRVLRNKGSAGIDNMTVDGLHSHLLVNWQTIRKALLEGRYIKFCHPCLIGISRTIVMVFAPDAVHIRL